MLLHIDRLQSVSAYSQCLARGFVPRNAAMTVWKPPPPSAMQVIARASPGIPHPFSRNDGIEVIVNMAHPRLYRLKNVSNQYIHPLSGQ